MKGTCDSAHLTSEMRTVQRERVVWGWDLSNLLCGCLHSAGSHRLRARQCPEPSVRTPHLVLTMPYEVSYRAPHFTDKEARAQGGTSHVTNGRAGDGPRPSGPRAHTLPTASERLAGPASLRSPALNSVHLSREIKGRSWKRLEGGEGEKGKSVPLTQALPLCLLAITSVASQAHPGHLPLLQVRTLKP